VGATFPRNLSNILRDVVNDEDLERITTSGLHRVLPHVKQTFVRCRMNGREVYLMHHMEPDLEKGRQVRGQ